MPSEGTALIATSQRIAGYFLGNYSSFPPVPQTPEEFVSEGLNVRPTFFVRPLPRRQSRFFLS